MNKDLYLRVFNNKFLNCFIFDIIYQYHRAIPYQKVYRWNDLKECPLAITANGYIELLKQYYQRHPIKDEQSYDISDVIVRAIIMGRLDIVMLIIEGQGLESKQRILETSHSHQIDYLHFAVVNNRFEILLYLDSLPNIFRNYQFNLSMSPHSNNLEMVRYFSDRVNGTKKTPNLFDNAAASGNLEIIKWLATNRTQDRVGVSMYFQAVFHNRMNVLEFLRKEKRDAHCTKGVNLLDTAAKRGNFNILMWLHRYRIGKCSKNAMDYAAGNNDLGIVKWLHENRTEGCSSKAMELAAENNHLDVVKWLFENRTEGNIQRVIDIATFYNHNDMVEWLTENSTFQ
ncbi:hypothetical protein PPL_04248 [Heterostelium album PN500]|uniref:Ankyrin repeat protein n=1 Tax=Heterostelium pallidum (strain ATCC 26659 / Pp 5 / PN500) TaxID=670386 RepID=D3B717_HETP5|nr:hypothetical protein PPL_04248 [Heterostelium album PN500]EFA82560.1 hypothetical protein PPL_04248 [Heterostelium album PN500]|eukprot:XP_020434677.1 hypothetical protein PPL_04248 [Heterostelium album PN500]